MSQTSYDRNMAEAFAGMKCDSRFDLVETVLADKAVYFGRAVAGEAGRGVPGPRGGADPSRGSGLSGG